MMLVLVLVGLLSGTAGAQCAGGTVSSTVFDNLVVSSDCVINADVTGNVEVTNGATATLNADVFGSLSLGGGTSAVVNGNVQGGIEGFGASSVSVGIGGTVGSLRCSDCGAVAVEGCATSIELENPDDGTLIVDCQNTCFGGECACESPPSISIKGGTMSAVSITKCEPETGASAQDVLVTETTFKGSFAASDAVFSDVLFEKLSCDGGAAVTLTEVLTQSDVSFKESDCAFVLGPDVDPDGDLSIEKVDAITITGLATSEAVQVTNVDTVTIGGSAFTGAVEVKESKTVAISNTCFLAGASLEKNDDVTCDECFVGFGGIKCVDNGALTGSGNVANPEKPDVIEGCGNLFTITPGATCTV